MTADYRPGELVKVTIRGRVHALANATGYVLALDYDTSDGIEHQMRIITDSPSVTVERVAPAEWPPRPGDLWRDRHGSVWFAFRDPRGWVLMQAGDPTSDQKPQPETVITKHGPLELMHREPEAGAS